MKKRSISWRGGFIEITQSFASVALIGNGFSALLVWLGGIRSLWPESGAGSIGISFLYTIPFLMNLPLLLQPSAEMHAYRRLLTGLNVFILSGIVFWVLGKLKDLNGIGGLCDGPFGECVANPLHDPIFLAIIATAILTCLVNIVVISGNERVTDIFFKSAVPAFMLTITATVAYALNLFCLPPAISPILHCTRVDSYEVPFTGFVSDRGLPPPPQQTP